MADDLNNLFRNRINNMATAQEIAEITQLNPSEAEQLIRMGQNPNKFEMATAQEVARATQLNPSEAEQLIKMGQNPNRFEMATANDLVENFGADKTNVKEYFKNLPKNKSLNATAQEIADNIGAKVDDVKKYMDTIGKAKNAGGMSKVLNVVKGIGKAVIPQTPAGKALALGMIGGQLFNNYVSEPIANTIAEWTAGNPNDMIKVRTAEEIANSGTNLRAKGQVQKTKPDVTPTQPAEQAPTVSATKTTVQTTAPTPKVSSIEKYILANADPNANYVGNIPPTTVQPVDAPVVNNNTGVQPVPTNNVENTVAQQSNAQALPVSQTQAVTNQVTPVNPQYLEMYNNIINQDRGQFSADNVMNAYRDMLARQQAIEQNNPYYQGGVINPQGYSIDLDKLKYDQSVQEAYVRLTNPAMLPELRVAQSRQMYNAQMANQAGVPYEDYIRATTERQANEIARIANEQSALMKLQANEATDMKTKLDFLQKAMEIEAQGQREIQKVIAEGEYDLANTRLSNMGDIDKAMITGAYELDKIARQNQGNLDVAQLNNMGDIALKRMELSDPYTQLKNIGSFYGQTAYTNPAVLRGILQTLPPQIQTALFSGQLQPAQINEIFQFTNNQLMNQGQTPMNQNQFMNWLRGIANGN